MTVEEGGVGNLPTFHREVVALPAGDLRIKDAVERGDEAVVAAHVESDLLAVGHPVETPPDFAAEELGGALVCGERANPPDHFGEHRDMRAMLVGRVVGIDDRRSSGGENCREIFDGILAIGILDLGAWVAELSHESVTAHDGGLLLLLCTHPVHLGVAVVGVGTAPRAARPVRAGDPPEPLIPVLETGEDAMRRHELEIILMSTDAQMSHSCRRFGHGGIVGNEKAVARMAKLHEETDVREGWIRARVILE